MPRGTVEVMTVASRVLRGNPLGDPSTRHLPVYLPPGYAQSSERYPALVALTGFTGSGRMLLNIDPWGEPLNERLDRLILQGDIGPMIVVMPDCFTRFGGSQYLNSSATGRYADHLLREVIPQLDATYRTLPSRQHRGVFGKSSGGFGALRLGMDHPDMFGGVACHSGDLAFEYCYLPDFPKFLAQVERHGGVVGFVAAFEAAPKKTFDLITAMNVLAMAACYSPNRSVRPFGIELPMDLHTGALGSRVWGRWLRHDPLRRLPRSAAALRSLRLLYIECGTRDEFNLHLGARQLVRALERLKVRHVYREFPDGHMGLSYRYDVSLPYLWRALQPAQGRVRRRAAG
jgi:enterochelin esterase family protein